MLCGVVGKYGLPDKLFQPVSPVVLQPGRGRFCKWNALPEFMRTEEVRPYYDALRRRRAGLAVKRTFDFAASSVLLVLLAPLFLFLAVLIKLDSKGPVFYRQERVTQYGRRFYIYKFRTMVENADQKGSLVTVGNDVRITRMGEKLRGCRLDEIPQLINIWKGEMSFVGTRPEVARYVRTYTKEMYATLLLPAGVTSMASIHFQDEGRILEEEVRKGRSVEEAYVEKALPEKMKWNLDEMRKFSLFREWAVLIKTVWTVTE